MCKSQWNLLFLLHLSLCVCSAASAQLQCRCCDLWPPVWQEVWLQSKHGCQPASYSDWDGEVCSTASFSILFLKKFCSVTTVFVTSFFFLPRILRVGGSLVLLLSPQLSCLLKRILAQRETGPVIGQETMELSGKQDCTSSSLSAIKQQTALSQEDNTQTGPGSSSPPALSSLTHQSTHRISLGAIDGLIHKYVKTWDRHF